MRVVVTLVWCRGRRADPVVKGGLAIRPAQHVPVHANPGSDLARRSVQLSGRIVGSDCRPQAVGRTTPPLYHIHEVLNFQIIGHKAAELQPDPCWPVRVKNRVGVG